MSNRMSSDENEIRNLIGSDNYEKVLYACDCEKIDGSNLLDIAILMSPEAAGNLKRSRKEGRQACRDVFKDWLRYSPGDQNRK